MSTKRKQWTDAEKIAFYKKKASNKGKARAYKSKSYYKYKANENAANRTERQKRIDSHTTPGYISAAGSMLGGMIHPVAGFLGGKLGHLVEQVTGFGDYKVTNNSILRGGMSPPQIVNSVNKGEVIIRHREYIGDVRATTDFTVQSFLINPGLSNTFPWLAQIAPSYEQYKLRGMLFEFNSTSSDALLSSATSTALGTVIMMTDYDVADNPPTTKRQMLNSEWSSSSKPSCTFIHPIECKRSLSAQNVLYTRNTLAVPPGFDQRLYDFGRFNIATEGMQAAGGVLGELWVTYEIALMKQQLSFAGLTDHFQMTTITNARPLGTVIPNGGADGDTLGGQISGDALSYGFPQNVGNGIYQWTYSMVGSVATPSLMSPTFSYINGNAPLLLSGNLNRFGSPADASTTSRYIAYGFIEVTKQNAFIVFSNTGILPSGTTSGDFWVTRVADSIRVA